MHDAESVSWVSVTTATDVYGNATTTEAAPVELMALVAGRLSAATTEAFDSREPGIIVGKTLYLLDATVEPGASDWFTVRGERYEVVGEPHRWGTSGVVVSVKRADVAP
jgi:hypothetical protein